MTKTAALVDLDHEKNSDNKITRTKIVHRTINLEKTLQILIFRNEYCF